MIVLRDYYILCFKALKELLYMFLIHISSSNISNIKISSIHPNFSAQVIKFKGAIPFAQQSLKS